jgi:hypothetical protein
LFDKALVCALACGALARLLSGCMQMRWIFIKVKEIVCSALSGIGVNSGLRLIYAHFPEKQKITFSELYHKNDKENEDRNRITDICK